MAGMKQTSKKTRLQADSYKEIVDPFSDLVTALAKNVEYRGVKLKGGHVLNALIYDVIRLSIEEQQQIARKAIERLEAFVQEDPADKADLSPPAPREPVIKDVNHKRGSSSRPKRGAG